MHQRDELMSDLPPDARSALLGLIGSTFAELKKVDAHIISRNENVTAMKTDLTKLVQEANNLGRMTAQQPQPQPQLAHTPVLEPVPVNVQPLQPRIEGQPTLQTYTERDPNQLEFDFYRKITPEDINNKFAEINLQLSNIVDKIEKLLTIVADGLKDRE